MNSMILLGLLSVPLLSSCAISTSKNKAVQAAQLFEVGASFADADPGAGALVRSFTNVDLVDPATDSLIPGLHVFNYARLQTGVGPRRDATFLDDLSTTLSVPGLRPLQFGAETMFMNQISGDEVEHLHTLPQIRWTDLNAVGGLQGSYLEVSGNPFDLTGGHLPEWRYSAFYIQEKWDFFVLGEKSTQLGRFSTTELRVYPVELPLGRLYVGTDTPFVFEKFDGENVILTAGWSVSF